MNYLTMLILMFVSAPAFGEAPQYFCICQLEQSQNGKILDMITEDVVCPKGAIGQVRCVGYRIEEAFHQECGVGEFERPNRDWTPVQFVGDQLSEKVSCYLSETGYD